jgi:hypothetical protein
MANTTFSGPVISKNGFTNTGPGMTVSLTADTTLTVATHAGKNFTLQMMLMVNLLYLQYQCR